MLYVIKGGGSVSKKKTHEEYVKELVEVNPNIEVIERYIGARIKIFHRCKICNYEWTATPDKILRGCGCPKCAGNMKLTHEEYVEKVKDVNPNIEVLGKYINSSTKILHRCKIDGYEWYARPYNILNGRGCPKCKSSKGEKAISIWLKEKGILYESQKIFEDCKNTFSLPFDFYLPKYNICIEFQGRQHYEPIEYFGGEKSFETQILRDNIKKDYCKNNGILLFEIPYYSDLDEELVKLHKIIKTINAKKEVVA